MSSIERLTVYRQKDRQNYRRTDGQTESIVEELWFHLLWVAAVEEEEDEGVDRRVGSYRDSEYSLKNKKKKIQILEET